MIRLLYTSTSCIEKSDPSRPLVNILDTSTKNNARNGVTGLLMHGGGIFIQLLEGADDQVFRLYVKLLDDPRHANCRVIFVTPIKKRLFAEWAMAAMTVPDSAFREIEEILAQSYETIEAKLLDKVMKLFMRG